MSKEQPNNPLHGLTLENILTQLYDHYGWDKMGEQVKIACFTNNPSMTSSLKFLRKNPWAREKVEEMFLRLQERRRQSEANNPKV